jgi:hypothetical protein
MRILNPYCPRINWKAYPAPLLEEINHTHLVKKHETSLVHVEKKRKTSSKENVGTFSNCPFGFKWKNMSCAFDAVVTMVIHMLNKLSDHQRAALANEITAYETLANLSRSGHANNGRLWNDCKVALRRQIYDTTASISLDDIWVRLFQVKVAKSFFQVTIRHRLANPSAVSFHESSTYVLHCYDNEEVNFESIQHFLSVNYNINNHPDRCHGRHLDEILLPLPEILFIYMNTAKQHFRKCTNVDPQILIHNHTFVLHAVGYGSGGHFRARFAHSDRQVYEYEGMNPLANGEYAVRCRAITEATLFPFELTNAKYFAQCAMYIKSN